MHDAAENDDPNEAVPEMSIRVELDRILRSAAFANADRLKAFLSYVVEESLAGRGHRVAGKTIAHDIYGRAPDDGSASIVRVDAGRLRRKLSEYYEGEGAGDPVRIHIDSGGYAPRFEAMEPSAATPILEGQPHEASPQPRGDLPWLLIGAVVLALVVLVGVLLVRWQRTSEVTPPSDHSFQNQTERSALAERSTATLQASNLAEQASGLLFPIADVNHQKLATSMYREAIRIEPDLSDGYAGAGHSLGTLALLAPDAGVGADLLREAGAMADRAVNLAPRSGWSQSAAAWVAFANGDYERAVDLSRLAVSLDDMDGKTLDFHGVILGTTGHFAESADVSAPARPRNDRGRHPAHLNIHGVANFHLGNYETALASFNAAIEEGGPVGQLTLMYKAAAHQALGDTAAAKALLTELQATWPAFRPDVALKRFYQHPEHAEQVLAMLVAAGWSVEP
ncbi:hypothetical protein CLV78_10438 [Aliiruegeria haliotis]|uniref:ESX-1 secretion system protein EccA1-like N-terminal domain-containing protein n=1 Tax=Aliiruegeria haliotis TaxID=1280846 RepID=A0A2T0RQT0_9RHOB|nr:hypothetical protein [Aliiruegeria haliotis]PRY23549.1 hypothetical protein CLV78_10438 [Aliiruegeria haliotis]